MKRASLLAIALLLVVIIATVAACSDKTINYRLTINVEVDGVVHTGSGVIETKWDDQRFPRMGNAWHVGIRGEAVTVDLGERGMLFVTLIRDDERDESRNLPHLMLYPFGGMSVGSMTPETLEEVSRHREARTIPVSILPLIVRFRNIHQWKSIERVDPLNPSASLGPGVKLVSATIAVTDDPVTTGIERKVDWLQEMDDERRQHLGSGPTDPLAETIGPAAFRHW